MQLQKKKTFLRAICYAITNFVFFGKNLILHVTGAHAGDPFLRANVTNFAFFVKSYGDSLNRVSKRTKSLKYKYTIWCINTFIFYNESTLKIPITRNSGVSK